MNIKNLQTKGFVTLAYPENVREAVTAVMTSWQTFCSLPDLVTKQFPYSNDGAGNGYEPKETAGKHLDVKKNFDVSLAGEEWLLDQTLRIGNETVSGFVDDALSLVEKIAPMVMQFGKEVEDDLLKFFDIGGDKRENFRDIEAEGD